MKLASHCQVVNWKKAHVRVDQLDMLHIVRSVYSDTESGPVCKLVFVTSRFQGTWTSWPAAGSCITTLTSKSTKFPACWFHFDTFRWNWSRKKHLWAPLRSRQSITYMMSTTKCEEVNGKKSHLRVQRIVEWGTFWFVISEWIRISRWFWCCSIVFSSETRIIAFCR